MNLKVLFAGVLFFSSLTVMAHEIEDVRILHSSEGADHVHLKPFFLPMNVDALAKAIGNRSNLINVSDLVLEHVLTGSGYTQVVVKFGANLFSMDITIPRQSIACVLAPSPLTREAGRLPFARGVNESNIVIVMSDCSSENLGFFNIDFNLSELGVVILDEAYETGKEYVNVFPREEVVDSAE